MHEIIQKKPKIEIGVDVANLLKTNSRDFYHFNNGFLICRRMNKFDTLPKQKLRTFRSAIVPHLVPFKVARDGTTIFYLSDLKTNYNIFGKILLTFSIFNFESSKKIKKYNRYSFSKIFEKCHFSHIKNL